jgi:V8-like Glu-specific endopeptidase
MKSLKIIAIVLAFIFTTILWELQSCSALEHKPNNPRCATCRIYDNGSYTTGVVIHQDENGDSLVLTCAHGIETRSPVIYLQGIDPQRGKLLTIDRRADLALIELQLHQPVATIPIAESLELNETVQFLGFGHDNIAEHKIGRLVRTNYDIVNEYSMQAVNGDSGAGVVNKNWQLVGVVSATSGNDSYGAKLSVIRKFLSKAAHAVSSPFS